MSALLVESLMLGPLAAVVAAHYLAAMVRTLVGAVPGASGPTADDGSMAIAVTLLGGVWWLQRQGRPVPDRALSRAVGASVAILVVVTGWGAATAWLHGAALPPLACRRLRRWPSVEN